MHARPLCCTEPKPEACLGPCSEKHEGCCRPATSTSIAAIMEELLAECGSRTWRARQSSAGALAELVSGRRFEEVGRYLERVWRASLRVADDIKETVREAGWTLCRTTRGLTVRLCDAHHSSPAEVEATIAATLPMLPSGKGW